MHLLCYLQIFNPSIGNKWVYETQVLSNDNNKNIGFGIW